MARRVAAVDGPPGRAAVVVLLLLLLLGRFLAMVPAPAVVRDHFAPRLASAPPHRSSFPDVGFVVNSSTSGRARRSSGLRGCERSGGSSRSRGSGGSRVSERSSSSESTDRRSRWRSRSRSRGRNRSRSRGGSSRGSSRDRSSSISRSRGSGGCGGRGSGRPCLLLRFQQLLELSPFPLEHLAVVTEALLAQLERVFADLEVSLSALDLSPRCCQSRGLIEKCRGLRRQRTILLSCRVLRGGSIRVLCFHGHICRRLSH